MGNRVDALAAMIMAHLANIFRGKTSKTYKPADFMPEWESPAKPESAEPVAKPAGELLAKVDALNALFCGKDLRKQ